MRLEVRLFASYAEAFGATSLTLELPDHATVGDVLAAILARPEASRLPPQPAAAVNRRYAGPEVVVREGDEVALIPPVAGG